MAIVNQHPAFAKLGKPQKSHDIPVSDSSFLTMFKYDPNSQQLTVIFKNGAEYMQGFIDSTLVDKLIEAPNKSKFYVENIRGKTTATRIVDKTVGESLRRDNGKSNDDGSAQGARTNSRAKGTSESTGSDSGS